MTGLDCVRVGLSVYLVVMVACYIRLRVVGATLNEEWRRKLAQHQARDAVAPAETTTPSSVSPQTPSRGDAPSR